MAGVFDKISNALSGKKSTPAPPRTNTKAGYSDMSQLRSGMGDGHTTSGLDRAMQQHANKVHPIKVRTDMGEIQG